MMQERDKRLSQRENVADVLSGRRFDPNDPFDETYNEFMGDGGEEGIYMQDMGGNGERMDMEMGDGNISEAEEGDEFEIQNGVMVNKTKKAK